MSQATSGIRSILSLPLIYKLLQSLIGMHKARREYSELYLRPTPGMKILDIGCGPGDILSYLPDSIEYYGVDINEEYIKFAQKKFRKGYFIHGDVNNDILDPELKFDLIIATGLLHHLEDEEAKVLMKNMSLKLRDSGRMVTLDPCYTENPTSLVRLMHKWDRGQNIRFAEDYRKLALHAFDKIIVQVRDNMSRIPRCTAAILEYSKSR